MAKTDFFVPKGAMAQRPPKYDTDANPCVCQSLFMPILVYANPVFYAKVFGFKPGDQHFQQESQKFTDNYHYSYGDFVLQPI